MSEQEFDDGLRSWLHHEPFQPVVIEMTNNQHLLIDTCRVFFGKGSAVFMTSQKHIHIVDAIAVQRITPVLEKAAS